MTKTLAVITARGGSKGLPGKNVMVAGGKPLVAWTVEAAVSAECVDRVILSSDDDDIIAAAKSAGSEIPFRRPDYLSDDTASSIDVVLHAIDKVPGYDYVVLLQPTSPLRTSADIDAAFKLLLESGGESCVSICEADQSPYLMYQVAGTNKLKRILPEICGVTRRQDLPLTYVLNGAIYIAKVDWLLEKRNFIDVDTQGYIMPKERSLDIDTAADFEIFKSIVDSF